MATVKFKFVFEDSYNPVYCNGAMGGIQPNGEIVLNFYTERRPLPRSDIRELSDDGTFTETPRFEPADFSNTIIRFVQNGVIMNKDTAKYLHSCLGSIIEELEK